MKPFCGSLKVLWTLDLLCLIDDKLPLVTRWNEIELVGAVMGVHGDGGAQRRHWT